MKRDVALRVLLLSFFALLWSAAVVSPAAAQFHNGRIESLSPLDYPVGGTVTAKLKVRNTGVAGYFAAQPIAVPAGWTVAPSKTSAIIIDHDETAEIEFQITPPAAADFANKAIQFRLFAYENDFWEINADEATFQIRAITVSGGFELLSPAHLATGIEQPVTFEWSPSGHANFYKLELYEDDRGGPASTPAVIKTNLTENSYTLEATEYLLLPGKDYYWRVYAINKAGQTESSSGVFLFTTKTDAGLGPFEFITPSEDNVRLSTTPFFEWTASANVRSYYLQILTDTDGRPNEPVIFDVNIDAPATSYEWTGEALQPGKYHVLVSAFNFGGGLQVKDGVRPFTATKLSSFTQSTPAADATGVDDRPAFQWTPATNATGYRLELSMRTTKGLLPVGTITLPNDGLSTTWDGPPLARGAQYQWQVTALGTGEERPSENGPLTFTVHALGTFGVLSPVPDETGVPQQASFTWQPSKNAQSYSVHIAPSADGVPDLGNVMKPVELQSLASTDASLATPLLEPAKDYFFRVEALAGSTTEYNREGWVPFRSTDLDGFDLLLPANNTINVSLQPTLTWEPVANALKYRVYIAAWDFGVLLPAFDTETAATSVSIADQVALNGETVYLWIVEAIGENEAAFANAMFYFTTQSSVTATRNDLLDAILGRQVLSNAEKSALGIGADEDINVSTLLPPQ